MNIPRFGTPDDVANVACFIGSDDASYINGNKLYIYIFIIFFI